MKKALAILMTIALVSTAAFADVATTIATAPTVTLGASATVEADLAKGNTIAVTAPGKATDAASKSEPIGLNATKFVSNDWVNLDWSKMTIKAEGKLDAYRSTADDWSFLKVTTTWKNFFGFAIAHTYARDNKEAGVTKPELETLNKNATNEISATLDKTADNGVKFWTVYDADWLAFTVNVFKPFSVTTFGNGFKSIGFEYDNAEFYSKLVYKNDQSSPELAKTTGASVATVSSGPVAGNIDTAIIEARKMFSVWTVRINDSGENKIRIQNLGSDCKVADVNSFVVGKDYKIQATDTAATATAALVPGKRGMNFWNTLTPIANLTIKLNALAPSNTAVTIADWLKGDNLVFGAAYAIDKVGTVDAGFKVSTDYTVNKGGFEGPSLLLANVTAAGTTSPANVTWGNGFWLGAKLDKDLLGANKSVYVGLDMTFGSFVDALETNKAIGARSATSTDSLAIKVGSATKTNINAEAKMVIIGDGTAAGSLTANAGILATLLGGVTYASVAPTGGVAAATAGNFGTAVLDPLNVTGNTNWVSGNYNEANVMNKYYGDGKATTSPFALKARVDYVVNSVVTNVYIKDSYKALAGDLSTTTIASGRKMYGFYDTNTLTLGTQLAATAKGSLTASLDYNMFLGLPTSANLYVTDAPDATRKVVDANTAAAFGSGDFSPVKVTVGYSYTY